MQLADYDYLLPPERIAQEAVEPRDRARMLVHRIGEDRTAHQRVRDLPEQLEPGDLLVINDTRVRPARLFARRQSGGRVEFLFLGPVVGDGSAPAAGGLWRAMVRPARKLTPDERLSIDGCPLCVQAVARELDGDGVPGAVWRVQLVGEDDEPLESSSVETALEDLGRMPLPPYIAREPDGDPRDPVDRTRYQTVYARRPGAVAAPTAGLHFTDELLERVAARGVSVAAVTLHVGLGTFLPVTVEDPREHPMHAEWYAVSEAAVAAVEACRERGGRVVAVGTTSVRALESCAREGELSAGAGQTRLFLHPGSTLQCVDGLLTNFHLPKSTLLMLVSALAGRERIMGLYQEAMERDYRFYSYGDAMLLLP